MWYMHEGIGWWMVFGGVWMLLFWGGIIALVVWGITKLSRQNSSHQKYDAIEIARER